MNDPTTPDPDRTYAEEAAAFDRILGRKLQALRDRFDAGDITAAETAAERVRLLEHHLAAIQNLRREYFGGDR